MADISSIGGSGEGPLRSAAIDRASQTAGDPGRVESARRQRATDSVSLSDAARSASKADTSDVRTDLTSRVRAELDAGTYVTEDKLDAAVENLVDRILRG